MESAACGEDELYYGSTPVHLAHTTGQALNFSTLVRDMSQAALEKTIARNSPIAAEQSGPRDVLVPCVPARELVAGCSADEPAMDLSAWPQFLRTPVVKAAEASPGEPKARFIDSLS